MNELVTPDNITAVINTFETLPPGEEVCTNELFDLVNKKTLEEIFIEEVKGNYNYPEETIKKALKRLKELNLILKYPVSFEKECSNKTNKWKTDLGNIIFNLLNKN